MRNLSIILAIAIIALALINNAIMAEQGQKLLVIEKNVCFDISITAPSDREPTSKTICLVIDFYIYNVRNVENASVVIVGGNTYITSFPP